MGAGALFLIVDRHAHRNCSMVATLSAHTAAVQWRMSPTAGTVTIAAYTNQSRPACRAVRICRPGRRSGAGTNRTAGNVS
jgi:hypothetical protein